MAGLPLDHDPEAERVCAAIWDKELAIYAARGSGDLQHYLDAVTATFLAWPPHMAAPIDIAKLRHQATSFADTRREQLAMSLTRFTLEGDTAIIFYTTHRTRLPDGAPADERFDVIHVWVSRQGDWRLLSGMARASPGLASGLLASHPPVSS